MSTFVLVHGAWHGGWCWKRVRRALQAQGHEVFTPTLTGLADRSHLLTPEVNLETHILDVVSLLRWEELTDVVLCGHSYGGAVVSGVADRVPERLRALVYLDAFVPEDGESLADHRGDDTRRPSAPAAGNTAGTPTVPPYSAEMFGVNPADRAWVDRLLTPQPLACFLHPLRLTGGIDQIRSVTYILATAYAHGSPMQRFYDKAQSKGWHTHTIACGHDVMIDRPEELVQMLLDAVG